MTFNAGQPPPKKHLTVAQRALDRQTDPIEEHTVRQADELLTRLQKARDRHKVWSEATANRDPTQIKLAETELADAEQDLADVEAEYHYSRGDHHFKFDDAAAADSAEVKPEAEPVPRVEPGAPSDKELEPALPWWQLPPYDIFEMAQNIGARLKAKNFRTSNVAISNEIESRINEMERGKGRDRRSPSWDTIRGVLTRWKWKPD